MALGLGDAGIISAGIGAASAKNINEDMQKYATEMSNTSYQRAVADMRAAGINPMTMAAKGGGGASSMSPQLLNPGEAAAQGLMAAARAVNIEQPKADAERENTKATTQVRKEEANNKRTENELLKAQKQLTTSSARKVGAEADVQEVKGNAAKQAAPALDKAGRAAKGWLDTAADYWFGGNNSPKYGGANSAKDVNNKTK